MPDVNVTIDGVTVSVPAGTNIVDAARTANTAVPVFCYHPKMKPVGMCRMCLVEVYTPKMDPATRQPVFGPDGKPELALMMNKLQTGCTTPVSDGMVVKTVTDRVKFAQKGMLEFLLTSHPLDCPVCDKGGECPLQNLTMQWGPGNSRYNYEDKVHFEKPIPLSELIYLDRERCILCARCVRFQDEIADDSVLGFDNRGRSWEIISKSEPGFDSKFSGNTTDICPVGALTSADFRFKARVWEVRSVPTVCTHCSVGCNLSLDMRYDDLMRVMPRENDLVNEIWSCDKGRFGMRYFGNDQRITKPLIRRNGEFVEATWQEAIQLVAEKLTSIRADAGGNALAGLAGPNLPNEDLYLFQRLFRSQLGSTNLDHRDGTATDGAIDDNARTFGVGAGTNLMTLGKGTSVLVIGADPEEEAPLYVLRLRGIATRGGDLTVVNSYATKLERSAGTKVRVRPGTEMQFALALLKVIYTENLQNIEIGNRLRGANELRQGLANTTLEQFAATTGVSVEAIQTTARAFASAENGIIMYGRQALIGGAAQALANVVALTGKVGKVNNGLIALTSGGNTRGALDMGVRPDAAIGGTARKAGLSAFEMWGAASEGKLRAMYIAGLNPVAINPAAAQALDALEFVVVQDMFMTETAKHAHVILPVASTAERDGTTTNAERRVQRFRQARQALANLPADWKLFQEVAQAMNALTVPALATATTATLSVNKKNAKNKQTALAVDVAPPAEGWDYLVSSDIADEISRRVPGYSGTSYTSLELTRKSWGRQPNEAVYYDGTSYENTEGIGVQLPTNADDTKSAITLSYSAPPLSGVDAQYGFTLLTPARAYDGGEWMRGSRLQTRRVPPHAILSVADAQRLGISIGERVRVSSAAGTIELMAQVDSGLAEGVVLVPAVRGALVETITTGAQTRVNVSKAE